MVRCLAIVALFFVLGGCNNKGTPAGTPSVTSSVYLGTLNDTVLAVIFSNAHLDYSGTQYRYTLNSDGTFKVDENVGRGL